MDAVKLRPLADDLFFIAHDGLGRPQWPARAVGLGLAGGLLCELIFAGRLLASQGRLRVMPGGPPADEVAHLALALVESEPQHRDLRTWLAVLMQRATEDVAGRLMRAHLVAPNTSRGRSTGGAVPADGSERGSVAAGAAVPVSGPAARVLVAGRGVGRVV